MSDNKDWKFTDKNEFPPDPGKDIPYGLFGCRRMDWIEDNYPTYVVHIVGAPVSTVAYYGGEEEFLGYGCGERLNVDKWQELPAV